MDKERFDDLVRRLAEERNRRSVLTGMGGAVLASISLSGDAEADSGKKKGKKDRKAKDGDGKKGKKNGGKGDKGKKNRNREEYGDLGPGIEGPCGDGRRPANVCTKNNQCCTGICDIELGKRNVDRNGRCRCIRKGGQCAENRNCCNTPCIGGICGFLS